jgi:hypothetical protein
VNLDFYPIRTIIDVMGPTMTLAIPSAFVVLDGHPNGSYPYPIPNYRTIDCYCDAVVRKLALWVICLGGDVMSVVVAVVAVVVVGADYFEGTSAASFATLRKCD